MAEFPELWLWLAVAAHLLAPACAPAHPGLLRMAGAGRGPLLGVPATLRMKYPAIATPCGNFTCHLGNFTCLDGERVVPAKKINDNQCDCEDGSDEPSTSACASGRFFCTNNRHTSQWLNSSSVNDGTCDCCDGTDEHERGGCPNTCAMLSNYARHVKQASRAPVVPAASLAGRRAQREANERARRSMQAELGRLVALQASSEEKYRNWVLQYGEEPDQPNDSENLPPAEEPESESVHKTANAGRVVAKENKVAPPRVVAIKGRPFARGDDLKFKEGDVIVVERKDDMIWWFGYVEGDERAGHGRFASNLVVALGDNSDAMRQRVLQQARVDTKAQTAEAVAKLETQQPKRLAKDEAIAQAKQRAEAKAVGQEPQIAALPAVAIDEDQYQRTAKAAHNALRRERTDRALKVSRLQRRLNIDVPTDWLHLHGRCLILSAGEQGQFKVCLFEKVERFPFIAKGDTSVETDSSNKSAKVNSMVQLIGKWNSATWKLHSWPGQTQAENDTSQHQSEPTNSLPVTLAGEDSVVSAPIIMHFDAGAACSAQPGVNFSATVEMRCGLPSRTKTSQVTAGVATYDELKSVHQVPQKPCHYIFALATPDACKTHHVKASQSAIEVVNGPTIIPVAPLDTDDAFKDDLLQAATQKRSPVQDPAEVASERRAAEAAHRASMEEARKQRLLDMQMQRQLDQIQKQGAMRQRKAEAAERELVDPAGPMQTASSQLEAMSADESNHNGKKGAEKDPHNEMPQLSHGVLSHFGSPPATPEGVPPQVTEDREL